MNNFWLKPDPSFFFESRIHFFSTYLSLSNLFLTIKAVFCFFSLGSGPDPGQLQTDSSPSFRVWQIKTPAHQARQGSFREQHPLYTPMWRGYYCGVQRREPGPHLRPPGRQESRRAPRHRLCHSTGEHLGLPKLYLHNNLNPTPYRRSLGQISFGAAECNTLTFTL